MTLELAIRFATRSAAKSLFFVSLTTRSQGAVWRWWADRDSNPDSKDYESSALTVKLSARKMLVNLGKSFRANQAKSGEAA